MTNRKNKETGHSILIVEDEGIVANHLRSVLTRQGYHIFAMVPAGEEALQTLGIGSDLLEYQAETSHGTLAPDLVLMDINLDGHLNGIETATQIRARLNIPVIYMTAHAEDELLQKAKITEPYGYLVKPVQEKELFATIEMALYKHQTEKTLRESEEKLHQITSSLREVTWLEDIKTRNILYVNPAYEELWGRTCESLYQNPTSFLDAVHPEDKERVSEAIKNQYQGAFIDAEYRILRPDNNVRWVWERSFPVKNETGEVYRLLAVVEDITERKQAKESLQRAHDELEHRTRELATLLAASHNLASTLEMESLLGLILDQLKTMVDCYGATIFRLEGEDLIALAHRGPIPQNEVLRVRFPVGNAPFYQQMALRRIPVIIPDVQDNTSLAQAFQESVDKRLKTTLSYIRSWMGIPLMSQERVMGLLGLEHDEPNYYTLRHAELAVTFANQAAMAIENARLYEQAQELATIKERQRLARELHDSVSQSLFSASLSAEVLPRLWERNPEEGRRCLEVLRVLTRGALAEMRTLLLELRPAALVETELGDLLGQLVEAALSRAGLQATLTVEPHYSFPPEVQVALYRIAQEALNNVVKHAGAKRVILSLLYLPASSLPDKRGEGRGVELRISDDGRGFDGECVPPVCLGLSIMRERAETIGATFEVESQVGYGTQVLVVWPGIIETVDERMKQLWPSQIPLTQV